MSWFSKMMGLDALRSLDATEVYGAAWSAGWDSVMSVTGAEGALRLIPVYSATGLIADMVSGMPVDFYGRRGVGVETPAPAWWKSPDPRISLFDWRHQMMTSLLLRGNAYGLVIRDRFQEISAIIWIPPARVQVDETGAIPVYRFDGGPGHLNVQAGGDVVHLRAYTVPGTVVGLSPIAQFRRQFEMSRNALMTGHDYYNRRAVPSGVLSSKGKFKGDQASVAKERAKAAFASGDPLVLDETWTWEQVSLSASDAAFLETIKATANQIAAIFRVEPEDVGGASDNSLRYSTVEGNQRKFNIRTLMPWATRIEVGLQVLLLEDEYMKHNLDALARPNLLELNKSIDQELKSGTLTLPEARALRDRQPLTPEEIEQWQQWYGNNRAAGGPATADDVREALRDEIPKED